MDITQLILDDHHEQRRLFAILEQIPSTDSDGLRAVWNRLSAFLRVHAAAEEEIFYPELLLLGKDIDGEGTPVAETKDAIKDHNDIRDALTAVDSRTLGSDAWFDAVDVANKANGDHMAEEEREGLTDFRRHASLESRHDLGVAFSAFQATHITGVRTTDTDPEDYIAEHERPSHV